MKNIITKKPKFVVILTALVVCLATLGTLWMVQAQAAGKYITKVEGTYTSSLNLLKLEVSVDLNTVGDVKATVNGKNYTFTWSNSKYERSIAGVKIGSTIKMDAYNFDGKVIETKTYTLDKTGKIVEKTPVKTVPVTAVSLNVVLKAGSAISFEAMVTPTNATNKQVTWTSSDSKIASVDSTGNVRAVKTGYATITATTKDGAKKVSIKVRVK